MPAKPEALACRSANPQSTIRTPQFPCKSLISRFSKFSFVAAWSKMPAKPEALACRSTNPQSTIRTPQFSCKSLISRFPEICSLGFSRLLCLLAACFPVRVFGVFRGGTLRAFHHSSHSTHVPPLVPPSKPLCLKGVPPCSAIFHHDFLHPATPLHSPLMALTDSSTSNPGRLLLRRVNRKS